MARTDAERRAFIDKHNLVTRSQRIEFLARMLNTDVTIGVDCKYVFQFRGVHRIDEGDWHPVDDWALYALDCWAEAETEQQLNRAKADAAKRQQQRQELRATSGYYAEPEDWKKRVESRGFILADDDNEDGITRYVVEDADGRYVGVACIVQVATKYDGGVLQVLTLIHLV